MDIRVPIKTRFEGAKEGALLDEVFGEGDTEDAGESRVVVPADTFFEDIHVKYKAAMSGLQQGGLALALTSIIVLESVSREEPDYQWPIIDALLTLAREAVSEDGEYPESLWQVVQPALTVVGRRDPTQEDFGKLNLHGAALCRMIFRGGNWSGAIFSRSDLQGADLGSANLSEADLTKSRLTEANLHNTDLSGADLRGAEELTQEQLDLACGDERTKLSDGFKIAPC